MEFERIGIDTLLDLEDIKLFKETLKVCNIFKKDNQFVYSFPTARRHFYNSRYNLQKAKKFITL